MSNPHEFAFGRYRNGAGLLATFCMVMLMIGCTRNEPPSVSAGAVQAVDAGERVTLSGEASDPDGSVVTYH